MPNRIYYLLLALVFFSTSSCNLFNELDEDDNELKGNTNIPLNKVGNTFTPVPYVNGNYLDIEASISITQNNEGVVSLSIVADIQNHPELSKFNDMIPDIYKDNQGRLNTVGKLKITSEGFQDFSNIDEAPFTVVKYDCKVGDTYKLKKSDGKTITRTVTQKSTDDDFSYGFLLIKTITVEQDSRIPGIEKIVYRFNHKFGLVSAEIVAEDGSRISSLFYPENY